MLPQDGDRVIVLKLAAVPQGAVSLEERRRGLAGVRPRSGGAAASKPVIDLDVWAPYRNDPGLIKELLSAR